MHSCSKVPALAHLLTSHGSLPLAPATLVSTLHDRLASSCGSLLLLLLLSEPEDGNGLWTVVVLDVDFVFVPTAVIDVCRAVNLRCI